MGKAKLEITTTIELTPEHLAKAFCKMYDEAQAQVFIEIAKIAKEWDGGRGGYGQWLGVGRHLATCECARDSFEIVEALLYQMQDGFKGEAA